MLARDEAHRIAGVAEACGDLVDDYCVLVDDRSEDDTPMAIFRELGSTGKVLQFRFEDFAQARNELFEAAREGLGAGDYLLLADPDSPPRGTLPAQLGADVYDCEWRNGETTYRLPILVRADLPLRYEGACHEYLTGADIAAYTAIDTLWVDVTPRPPGGADRCELYLELLGRDAATNPRSAFYLARTLEDAGRAAEAIGAYLLRAQMLGWDEETFFCLYRAGVCMRPFDLEQARHLLERARRYRPARLEPIAELARLANDEHRYADAVELCLEGLRLPRSDDRLFVNRYLERSGLGAELQRGVGGLAAAVAAVTLKAEEAPHG
jgi:tetratricopeptide (TPR) repeat protein